MSPASKAPSDAPRRKSSFIHTFAGKIDPLNPQLEHISIVDIAHHLALRNRYSGATSSPYSVAQHSVLVSLHVEKEFALDGLLHDAEETYFPDMVRPIKQHLTGWSGMVERMKAAVAERFEIANPEPRNVMDVDTRILIDERNSLMRVDHDPDLVWPDVLPLGIKIKAWPWGKAKSEFLNRFRQLGGKIE